MNFTADVERQVGQHITVGANYGGSIADNLPEGDVNTLNADNDINRVTGSYIANKGKLVRPLTSFGAINGQHQPDLQTFGSRVPIPWIVSPAGWGIFIGQPQGSMVFTQTEGLFRAAEATSTRNVYLLLGDTPAKVMQEYADLSGHPHLPPLWSFGYQQSHRRLDDKDEILAIAKTFREKKLPCDAVIYLGTAFAPPAGTLGMVPSRSTRTFFPIRRPFFGSSTMTVLE